MGVFRGFGVIEGVVGRFEGYEVRGWGWVGGGGYWEAWLEK